MAYLFHIKDKTVFPTEETLLREPYKTIWKRDTSVGKEIAIKEFAYIEFMTSFQKSNPYKGYSEEMKLKKILDEVIKDKDWFPDELIEEAIKDIETLQTEGSRSYAYYMAAIKASESIRDFFLTVDLGQVNFKTGNPLYKPRDVTSALKDTEIVLTNLNNLKIKVEEELFEMTKKRAGKTLNYFGKAENALKRN